MRQNGRSTNSVTIIDVAREAGVSYATVSRVINDEEHVRPEKRERVLKAMAQLGFSINPHARSLRGGRSHTIGLLVRDLGTGYIGEIIRGIDSELAEAQYDLVLYTTHRNKAKESAYVANLTRGLADGLLITLPADPEAYLASLRQRHFPYVLIDHRGIDDKGPAVGAANRQGARSAVEHLAALGHRRIGLITGALDLGCARDRQTGYRAALEDLGLGYDPGLVREGDFNQPRGYEAATELLTLADPPTAIFASNDVSAFGVMEAVRDQGKRIPDDVSIVGFDDIPQAAQVNPPLTTVRQPLEQMGRQAARMLLEIMKDPERPAGRLDLATELVVRGSTQAPKAGVG
jgi:LacI family transcriptional regulator